MRHYLTAIGVASLLLATTACNPPDHREADAKALRELETQWVKDIASRDVEKFASYYADDASMLSPGLPVVTGKAAIRNAIKEMVSDPGFSLVFKATHVEVSKSGDLAYTQGTFTMTATNPETKQPLSDKGKYVTVFRKGADGAWKVTADVVNSDSPPPPPPTK